MLPEEFWNSKHRVYRSNDWIRHPTYFAEEVLKELPTGGELLDVGCGQGQDSTFFAAAGFSVTAMDFSGFALENFPPAVTGKPIRQVAASMADLPYPFQSESFDVVYSHLSLHYFAEPVTRNIVREFHRLLRPGGLLCVMVNSVDDPECGEGTRLGPDYYELSSGDRKRYFSRDTLLEVVGDLFVPRLLEQNGRTRKDVHQAFVRLIAERGDRVSDG